MDEEVHVAAGILIKDKKLLITRDRGQEHFTSPGGRLEPGEAPIQTLIRELREETDVDIKEENCRFLGTYFAPAIGAGSFGKKVRMEAFFVDKWQGRPQPKNEIEEVKWISSELSGGIKIGHIFGELIIPMLKKKGLIE
jgi:8-oxo-dGTP diphosphatase